MCVPVSFYIDFEILVLVSEALIGQNDSALDVRQVDSASSIKSRFKLTFIVLHSLDYFNFCCGLYFIELFCS